MSGPPGAELKRLLEALEAPAPSPAGGTAAALAAAMAASLVVMVGRGSPGWGGGADAAARSTALRTRLLELGQDDVEALAAMLRSFRTLREAASDSRRRELGEALLGASEVPLEIARCAADVALLAVEAARDGKGPMRLDAEAAVVLAEAATRAATLVVRGNLRVLPVDYPSDRAPALLEGAQAAEERAAAALSTAR